MIDINALDLPLPDDNTRFSCSGAARIFKIGSLPGCDHEDWPPKPGMHFRLVKECKKIGLRIQLTDTGELYVTGKVRSGDSGEDREVGVRFGHWEEGVGLSH
ncbi:MAG: hypothetical protein AAGG01_22055 [Planctomycetota bacterium]